MNKKSYLQNLTIILTAAIPVLYLAFTWSTIPAIIPTHYNIRFEPDKTGSKNFLWAAAGAMFAVSLFVYFLLKNIYRIDPKRYGQEKTATFTRIAIGCVVFITALSLLLIIASTKNIHLLDYLLIPIMGLLFCFMGNYMHNIKPNYFAGFRLPWTLESESNWKKTHHLAGKLWFWGGLLIVIIGILIPMKIAIFIMFALLMVMAIIPIVFSYKLFKKDKTAG